MSHGLHGGQRLYRPSDVVLTTVRMVRNNAAISRRFAIRSAE
jgi:hypothetical protein